MANFACVSTTLETALTTEAVFCSDATRTREATLKERRASIIGVRHDFERRLELYRGSVNLRFITI